MPPRTGASHFIPSEHSHKAWLRGAPDNRIRRSLNGTVCLSHLTLQQSTPTEHTCPPEYRAIRPGTSRIVHATPGILAPRATVCPAMDEDLNSGPGAFRPGGGRRRSVVIAIGWVVVLTLLLVIPGGASADDEPDCGPKNLSVREIPRAMITTPRFGMTVLSSFWSLPSAPSGPQASSGRAFISST